MARARKFKIGNLVTPENICALVKSCNQSSGYPIYVFYTKGMKFKKDNTNA